MDTSEDTSCYTYKVEMIIQVLASDETTAKAQLDEKGGYITSRKVTFMDSVQVYKGNKVGWLKKHNKIWWAISWSRG